jgi:hypothetical protein
VRLDPWGNTLWYKIIGDSTIDRVYSLLPAPDDGFILSGVKSPTEMYADGVMRVIRFNAGGNTLWTFTDGQTNMVAYDIVATFDSCYVVMGSDFWYTTYRLIMLKLDQNGNRLWRKAYVDMSHPAVWRDIEQTPDSGFIVAGGVFNGNETLSDAGNTTTLSHYLALLDTAGLLTGLEKYSGTALRQRSSSPKFQVYNNALITAYQPVSFRQAVINPSLWGRMVESAVGAHLLNHAMEENFDVFYWRQGNREVDFIMAGKDQLVALEVKSGTSSDLKGIKAFSDLFHPVKVLLIGSGGFPWQQFLALEPVELF